MSELAVSNDVLRESLPVQAPPSLSARLEQHLSLWFPTFERRLVDALYWFSERAPWQRGAISMGVGAALGLSVVFAGAGVFGWPRNEQPPAAPAAHTALLAPAAVAPVIALPAVAAPSAPAAVPAPVPAVVATPERPGAEPLLEQPEPARNHAKKSRPRRRANSKARAWTFPRPQRRSP